MGCSVDANCNEVLAMSFPRWLFVHDVPLFLWHFLPKSLENLVTILRMDESPMLLPHLDARVVVSIYLDRDLPNEIEFVFDEETFSFPLKFLGAINACFLCCMKGHMRKNCPFL